MLFFIFDFMLMPPFMVSNKYLCILYSNIACTLQILYDIIHIWEVDNHEIQVPFEDYSLGERDQSR